MLLKKQKFSLPFIAFWQALGLVLYCTLVGCLMWQGEKWLGPPYTFLGPVFFLILFVVSVLISGLLVLAHPAILFWKKKQRVKAIRLVAYTVLWLALFAFLILTIFIVS